MKSRRSIVCISIVLPLAAGTISACSGPSDKSATSAGSQPSSGGTVSSGGASDTQNTGGMLAASAGGSNGTTSNALGGTMNTGGAASEGGAANTGGAKATGGAANTGGAKATGGAANTGGAKATGGSSTASTKASGGTSTGTGGSSATGGMANVAGSTSTSSGLPSGWLYTKGSKIYVSDGNGSGTQWMGRGVNLDDIFFCGYNWDFWMDSPEQDYLTMVSTLMSSWKPTFLRVSLAMNSMSPKVSWLSNPSQYKTPMTNIINNIGTYPNTYVLVVLRSDASMKMGTDEATYYPTSTTDAVYVALVDSFANSKHVMFAIANEPGGDTLTNSALSTMMSHAVGVIRAEEDRLGVPHHIVSVQGNNWTSSIGFYSTTPLTYDNVVYEVHGYPPATASYTYSNIPVIIGEYGSLTNSTSFYADIESKQIPNLAWDFEPYSDCTPDLLNVNYSSTNLSLTSWGSTVKSYLLAHAQ